MSNLRVIWDNAADRATTVASTTAGALTVAGLKLDTKGSGHRFTGTSGSYTLTWARPLPVSGVVLPATNLTTHAAIRCRAYDAAANLLEDTSLVWACPAANLGQWDWTKPLHGRHNGWQSAVNFNSFPMGVLSKTAVFFSRRHMCAQVVIDLEDATNPAGQIDVARLIVGAHHELTYNPSYGASNDVADLSTARRTASGDNPVDVSPKHDAMRLNLRYMPPSDRAWLNDLMRVNGISKPLALCLYPDNASDPRLAQDNLIYGRKESSPIEIEFFNAHTAQLQIEGW